MEKREYQVMFDVEQTHWWFAARRMFIKIVLDTIATGNNSSSALRIADIGAGTGGMTGFLRQYGTVIGIEPNAYGRRLAKKRGVTLRPGTAQKTGLQRHSVDMVCLLDVLYHRGVHDRQALSEAMRVLTPGGWLVITGCAFPWLAGPHDRATFGKKRYVFSDLVSEVKRAGFAVHKKTYTFFLLFPFFILKRLADRLVQKHKTHSDVGQVGERENTLLTSLCRLETVFLRVISYPWGSSLLILAQKPAAAQ